MLKAIDEINEKNNYTNQSAMNRFKDGGVVRLPLTTFQPPSLLEVFTYL